jgi:hypothetical protein
MGDAANFQMISKALNDKLTLGLFDWHGILFGVSAGLAEMMTDLEYMSATAKLPQVTAGVPGR